MLGGIKRAFLLAASTSVIAMALLFVAAKAGSIVPPGSVGSTMRSLQEVYDAIAGTFDSSGQSADINGNIIEQLKYISGMTLQQIYNNSGATPTIIGSSASAILTLRQSGAGKIIELRDNIDSVFSIDKIGNISMGKSTLLNTDSVQISSGGASDLVLNAGSGQIKAAAGDAFYTAGGHPIRASGEEIYRASMQILGYDFPAQTSSVSFIQISRPIILDASSFPSAMTGATRVYKIGLRYATNNVLADSTWRVWNITDGAQEGASFTIPHTATTDLNEGTTYITPDSTIISIPAFGEKWRLDLLVPAGTAIRVYQVELIAYDRVD